jgi:hypothetical protein
MGSEPAAESISHPAQADQENELTRLRAELDEYQDLIDELPAIYETKFSHQLRDVAQDIRTLMDERQRLMQQINHRLQGGMDAPQADTVSASVRAGSRHWFTRLQIRPWAFAAGTAALLLSLPLALVLRSQNRATPSPAAAEQATAATTAAIDVSGEPQSADSQAVEPRLQLRANGEVWLELRSPDGQLLCVRTLEPGEQLTFPWAQGMRIRSGRPHLLDVSLADQPFAPLGAVNDFSWRTLNLPADHRSGDPKSAILDQAS